MSSVDQRIQERIGQDPAVMTGKPVVRGTRVPVERIIKHLVDTPDIGDVLEAFPHLAIEDVQACLAFAYQGVVADRSKTRSLEETDLSLPTFGEVLPYPKHSTLASRKKRVYLTW